MTKIQKEVMEPAQLADSQQSVVNAADSDEYQVSKVLEWLMPWGEKTDGEQAIGSWEEKLPTTMMIKLLELWLTVENRERLQKTLQFYHPLDRAAMAYALLTYVMTGHKMTFKSAMANQHYKTMLEAIKQDMPELAFAGHMMYMMRKYGPKKVKSEK
jgi:hypothetical protein